LPRLAIDRLLVPGVSPPQIEIVRPGDLLQLRFSFVNLWLVAGESGRAPTLVKADARRPAYIVVETASQHITEQASFQSAGPKLPSKGATSDDPDNGRTTSEVLTKPPVFASISGPSRLVFTVGTQPILYTSEALLAAISGLDLNVAPHAAPPTF